MAWYKTGTISVTNGSATVTGSGTSWIANAAIGEALYAPDGRLYEITNIASNTSMTITPAYLGTNQSGQAYTIVPSQSYIRDLAAQAADLVNNYSTIANTIGQGKFPDGELSDLGFKFADDLDTGFYRSGTNEVTFVAGGVAQFKYDTTGITFVGSAGLDLDVLKIDGTTVTATAAELNILDGVTASTAEINVLDGVTATTAELNILDGVTATASEINKLDGASNLVEQTDIGTAPNEIPLNQYLGNLAYQDAENIAGNVGVGGDLQVDGTINDSIKIASNGNVGIGTSSPTQELEVNGEVLAKNFRLPDAGGTISGSRTVTGTAIQLFDTAQRISLFTDATERLRISSDGNVGIGTSSPGALTEIRKDNTVLYDATDDSAQQSNTATLHVSNPNGTNQTFAQIAFTTSASNRSIARIVAIRTASASNDLAFCVEGNNVKREAMRIDSSGNTIQTVNTTAATLTQNQTLTFSIVDNSTLRISVRGSDGVTRTATVALA